MLHVLKPITPFLEKDAFDQLEEMGFDSRFIQKAFCQSKDKSVSGLLNWLITNDNKQKGQFDVLNENLEIRYRKKGKNQKKNLKYSCLHSLTSILKIS